MKTRIALTQPSHIRFDRFVPRLHLVLLALCWVGAIGIAHPRFALAGFLAIGVCLQPMAREWGLVRAAQAWCFLLPAAVLLVPEFIPVDYRLIFAVAVLVLLLMLTETCRVIAEMLAARETRGRILSVRLCLLFALLFALTWLVVPHWFIPMACLLFAGLAFLLVLFLLIRTAMLCNEAGTSTPPLDLSPEDEEIIRRAREEKDGVEAP